MIVKVGLWRQSLIHFIYWVDMSLILEMAWKDWYLTSSILHNITSLGPSCVAIDICHWTPLIVSFCGPMTVLSILVIQGYTMGSGSQQLHESKIAFIRPFIILCFFHKYFVCHLLYISIVIASSLFIHAGLRFFFFMLDVSNSLS